MKFVRRPWCWKIIFFAICLILFALPALAQNGSSGNDIFAASTSIQNANSGSHAFNPGNGSMDDRPFEIRDAHRQKFSYTEASKIYQLACGIVRREFNASGKVRPHFTLVLGAAKNQLSFPAREIRLKKWDGFLFAQGVVLLAFNDLLPTDEVLRLSKRAVTVADGVVNVHDLGEKETGKNSVSTDSH